MLRVQIHSVFLKSVTYLFVLTNDIIKIQAIMKHKWKDIQSFLYLKSNIKCIITFSICTH